MSVVIPYVQNLGTDEGAFIAPNGKILPVYSNEHEEFTRAYCNGRDYDVLTGAVLGPPRPVVIEKLAQKEVKDFYQNPDCFLTSKLNKQELEKYRFWLSKMQDFKNPYYADFLVFALGYDKVENLFKKTIVTTSATPHVRFYNYYLMEWQILVYNRVHYDEKEGVFDFVPPNFGFQYVQDIETEEEINSIRESVPLSKRPLFFK